ncbi:hypothetical protein ACI3E1_04175 [Ligilactobacillus sp. LYQ139]
MGYWEKYSDRNNQQLAALPYRNYACGPHNISGKSLYIKSVIKQSEN